MTKYIRKIFGGLNITWPKLIIFAIIMGIWTALMAMFVPDGNSFHDIAVTGEWWLLPALLIVLNAKKPLEAATKVLVFFLISQPLVYLIQVPFSEMGWALFGYYKYWFIVTLLTFPVGFIAWFIKKDQWYSGLILSAGTTFLVITGVNYIYAFMETPPSHLVSIIYCFAFALILMLGFFKDKAARIIAPVVTTVALIIYLPFTFSQPYEVYRNEILEANNIVLVGEPYISFWSGEGQGEVRIHQYDDDGVTKYTFIISGDRGKNYHFSFTDPETEIEYNFKYYYDKDLDTVIVEKE
ncbi:hypothetical protein IKE19_00840 [Candidatus Saccharibacteria bacterium]|nr:hypothetical protein [Candidatus Saccharibacteria bacterium]